MYTAIEKYLPISYDFIFISYKNQIKKIITILKLEHTF